jgi:hypothetical protein
MCIYWCHEWIMSSVYYILMCAFFPGFSRHTAISPSVLSCTIWLHISSNWRWCKKAFCQCEILPKRACVLPVYTHHDTCFTMWVTSFIFSSFCHVILWFIHFTTTQKHDLIEGRTRYMLRFEEWWLLRWDMTSCNLVDRYKYLGDMYFSIIRVNEQETVVLIWGRSIKNGDVFEPTSCRTKK